jgi:hypothetical protein
MSNINKTRAAFEGWAAARGRSAQLSWTGSKYEHPRIQSQWIAFLMGWTMCNNQR